MQVVMFDRQSLFIQGSIAHLRELIPEITIIGTRQADEFWSLLSESQADIAMIDGDMHHEYCLWLLGEISNRFPALHVVVVLAKKNPEWVEKLLQHNVMGFIPRNEHPTLFASVLRMAASGMVCVPGEWLKKETSAQQDVASLSERQREVLKLLAEGESNKEIGRALNISECTVKTHLETLFRRLDVKNRTQAAMLYMRVA